jgi:cytochrome P450
VTTTITYNPFDINVLLDPYPHYAQLRAEAPLFHLAPVDAYLLSRYEDVREAIEQPNLFSSERGFRRAGRLQGFPEDLQPVGQGGFNDTKNLVASDPPEHRIMRRLVSNGFTPKAISNWEPRIAALIDEQAEYLLARCEDGQACFVTDFADVISTMVVAEILGVPRERRADFRRWTTGLFQIAKPAHLVDLDVVRQCSAELTAFLTEVIAERRRNPGDDVVSLLVQANDAQDDPANALLPEELIEFCALLLTAGTDTTGSLIGNWLHAMFADPSAMAALRSDPSLIGPSVEETLRYDAPAMMFFRELTAPAVVVGQELPAGQLIGLLYAAANHDHEKFGADADSYRVDRTPTDHIAFGRGPHICLGAPLARLESRLAITALLAKTSSIEPAGPAIRNPSFVTRGSVTIPVTAKRR